jgi:N-acetylmuramoyl-L-alanine amidase
MKRITKKSLTILLDAGHGGRDAGARVNSPKGMSVVEKDFTLALAKRVGEKLTAAGHTVQYTRTNDAYPSLPERIATAKTRKAELLLCIHGDTAQGGKPLSYSSIVFHVKRPAEKKLAECIATSLEQGALEKIRVGSDETRGSLMMLRESPCPAAMIEIGDMPKASVPATQEKIAEAIVQGVQKYLG